MATLVNRIMGKSDHLGAGIMYLLLSGVQMDLIDSRQAIKYVIYDTWFGASYGLRMYKARCGFVPVRAKWNLAELGDN